MLIAQGVCDVVACCSCEICRVERSIIPKRGLTTGAMPDMPTVGEAGFSDFMKLSDWTSRMDKVCYTNVNGMSVAQVDVYLVSAVARWRRS